MVHASTLECDSGPVKCVQFSPGGIASGSGNGTIELWDTGGELKFTLKGHLDSVLSLEFPSNGKYIASGSGDNTVKLWNIAGTLKYTLNSHSNVVLLVLFSLDGMLIASCSANNTVRLWDTARTLKYTLRHSHLHRIVNL